jgi:hypothetical protein
MRIDLLKNTKSRYDVLAYMTEGIRHALQRAHIPSQVLDLAGSTRRQIIEVLRRGKTQYTLGLNIIIDKNFLRPLKTEHIALFVDHMAWHMEALSCPETLVAFVDRTSAELFEIFGHERTLFLPHAVAKEWCQEKVSLRRDFDCVMAASFIDPEAIVEEWKRYVSKELLTSLLEVAEAALSSSQNHMLLLLAAIRAKGKLFQEVRTKNISLFDLITSLEQLIRAHDKIRLLNALEGHKIDLFSAEKDHGGWKRHIRGNIIYHDAVPFEEEIEIFRRTKVVINSMPTIKYGLHERLLYALAAGASVITNENPYLSLYFQPSRAMLHWNPEKPQSLSKLVDEALSDETARLAAGREDRHTIERCHTWDRRLVELLSMLPAH